ncbi:uncharacterized protein [Eurosta solidaginis]|uniref:uncharacterized protein n=1 Tax=Eurosta solidaginis TaxID=178769 RepID=UPI003530F9DC
MVEASHFLIFCTLCVMTFARPADIDDIFDRYIGNVNLISSESQMHIVKRLTDEGNKDVDGKKVSLKSIIGDLEKNFVQSASILCYNQSQSTESNPISSDNHAILKRKTEITKPAGNFPHKQENHSLENTTTTDSIETTTTNISTQEIGSTRIQFPLISDEPYYGDLPVIPAFDVNQAKLIPPTLKNGNSDSKLQTIDTTTNKYVATSQENAKNSNENIKEIIANHPNDKNHDYTEGIHDSNNRVIEKSDVLTSTTTAASKKSAEELKESEAELQEKIAEIEAEPVILSARV